MTSHVMKFWHGYNIVTPSRATPGGKRSATPREALNGMARYFAHEGARRITYSVHLDPSRVEIIVAVPRVSERFADDYEAVERFVNAAFFGDPTDGFDVAPRPPNDPPPQSESPAPIGVF